MAYWSYSLFLTPLVSVSYACMRFYQSPLLYIVAHVYSGQMISSAFDASCLFQAEKHVVNAAARCCSQMLT